MPREASCVVTKVVTLITRPRRQQLFLYWQQIESTPCKLLSHSYVGRKTIEEATVCIESTQLLHRVQDHPEGSTVHGSAKINSIQVAQFRFVAPEDGKNIASLNVF